MSDPTKFPRWLVGPSAATRNAGDLMDSAVRNEQKRHDDDIERRLTRRRVDVAKARLKAPRTPRLMPASATTSAGNHHRSPPPLDRILRINDVIRMIGLSNQSIYRMMKEGHFPKSHKLSPVPGSRLVGWSAREVLEWIRARIEADFAIEDAKDARSRSRDSR